MPECFGRFRDNLTIFCVCDGCNSFFGESIERILARESIFGVLRIQHGLKPVDETHEVGGRMVTTAIGEKTMVGVPLRFEGSEGTLVVGHEDAVGFERADGRVDWCKADELTAELFHDPARSVEYVSWLTPVRSSRS